MSGCKLTLSGLSKRYELDGGSSVEALVDLDLSIEPGEFVVIVGANGSGKTTLLNLIAGEIEPTSGTITVVGADASTDWTTVPRWERAWPPNPLARVRQDPKAGTVSELTVLENLRLAGMRDRVPAITRLRVAMDQKQEFSERLRRVGLEGKVNTLACELSGGQRQLLALEMALLRDPAILLLDEHTASLDRRNAARCMELTDKLCREVGITVLMVTHNLQEAVYFGDRLVVLRDGRLAANLAGTAKENLPPPDLFALCGFGSPRREGPAIPSDFE